MSFIFSEVPVILSLPLLDPLWYPQHDISSDTTTKYRTECNQLLLSPPLFINQISRVFLYLILVHDSLGFHTRA